MTATVQLERQPELQALHPLIYEEAEFYRDLPMAGGAIVPGRGSTELGDGSRWLTEAAEARVRAVGGYLLAHEDELVLDAYGNPTFDVVWSCGFAAASGQEAPDDFYREATMMEAYADSLGILEYFKGRVRFQKQVESSSTIGDGAQAVLQGLFGRRPWARFTRKNRLAVVSHEGPADNPKNGHMGRCVDAVRWAFRLKKDEILEIPAQGEDHNSLGSPESRTRLLTRIGTLGLHHTRRPEKLLARDAWMISVHQRLAGRQQNAG